MVGGHGTSHKAFFAVTIPPLSPSGVRAFVKAYLLRTSVTDTVALSRIQEMLEKDREQIKGAHLKVVAVGVVGTPEEGCRRDAFIIRALIDLALL